MAAQPSTRGRSRQHDRRCFGRLEQEDQRLKKHYGRWMDIIILRVIRRHFLATTGGRSTRHDRRCFGWLEQEDQRLKKHYGRWMDIVRSLELELFIY